MLSVLIVGALLPEPVREYIFAASTMAGVVKIILESIEKIRRRDFSLDYIAFLAMVVALMSDEFLAGAVIALMVVGGNALDEYASARAESALRGLAERIPKSCTVERGTATEEVPIQQVAEGEIIVVRPNELIPLDGTLRSKEALVNEANLTGEPLPVTLRHGAYMKSGGVNVGETLRLAVHGGFETSTYMRIVHLVDEAKQYQAPVVRLAERINFPFTAIALALALGAYFLTGEAWRALAVLVIATPCPLIIAAPVAFIGGLSRAARKNIIVKRPATLEVLTRVRMMFFDKTGTLTLGQPKLYATEVLAPRRNEAEVLGIASAIEFHSIHPLARAIRAAHGARGATPLEATNVEEKIGEGISGDVNGSRFTIRKAAGSKGLSLSLIEGEAELARFHFEDEVKEDIAALFQHLSRKNIDAEVLTGDRRENAERVVGRFGVPIRADLSPEDKFSILDAAKQRGKIVAMVGDGLNDAPALAKADVGIVFSGTENSAAIEAASVVVLGHDLSLINELFETARRSMRIASQSIWTGVSLSVVGMLVASAGFIQPVEGAILQEVIDVAVILNSLRAARR